MYDTVITTLMAHDGENSALMSYMYAMFGLGATVSPLIIGTLVDHDIHWKVGRWLELQDISQPDR